MIAYSGKGSGFNPWLGPPSFPSFKFTLYTLSFYKLFFTLSLPLTFLLIKKQINPY